MTPNKTGKPVGYIRESQEDENQTVESAKAGQIKAVQAMARTAGYDGELQVFDDWDRSGAGDKLHLRKAYAQLMADVEANRVSVIYVRSVDRLYRNLGQYVALQATCSDHGTQIMSQREGLIGGDGSPMAIAFGQVGAVFAEMESNTGKVRAKYGAATRRRNIAAHETTCAGCDQPKLHHAGRLPYGQVPGEDRQAVLDAFVAARSGLGACKRLNADGVPTRLGGQWDVRTVLRIVRLDGLGKAEVKRGVAAGRSSRLFSQLLHCPYDGSTMTPTPHPNGSVGYLCRFGSRNSEHPKPYQIIESKVTAAVEVLLAAVKYPPLTIKGVHEGVPSPADIAARFAEIDGRRARYTEMYGEGLIDRANFDHRLAEVAADRARVETTGRLAGLDVHPTFDLTGDPGEANSVMRERWSEIKLRKSDLRPTRIVWRATLRYGEDGPGS